MAQVLAKNIHAEIPIPESGARKGKVGALLLFVWSAMFLTVWGFAFVPAPLVSPEWMLAAQAACFGTLSNGLPASHGWLLLIFSPMVTLSFIWASHAEEIYEAPSVIRKSKAMKTLLLALVAVVMWEAHWTGKRITYALRLSKISAGSAVQNPLPLDYPRVAEKVPNFQLVNHQGQLINQEVFRGKVTLLTFAFAHCSIVCPMLIKTSLEAQKKVDSSQMQIVVITVDPWRDTPSSLPSLAQTWSIPQGSQMLSGEPDEITRVLKQFKVATARDLKTGDINHAGQIMVVGRDGQIAYSFLNPTVDWLVTASGRLLNE